MQDGVKIPKERIAVLIGEKGFTKRQLQKKTNTKISVSSDEGDVLISGEDSFDVFQALQIVKAIGRGVNPDIALNLLKENYQMEILNLKDFASHSKASISRIKARIIGTKGKARLSLEYLTNTHISIYGNTITIIGGFDCVFLARMAVEKLLHGSPHGNVYRWVQKQKASMKELNK